jgi:hypothetical protein
MTLLARLGRLADQAALAEVPSEGPVRDKLFHMLMRRIDVLAAHRAGVLALLRALPADPPLALFLACATRSSMRWMLDAAGIETRGLRGELRVKGLVGVWLWTLRAWQADQSADLSHTMAALDTALARAERMAGWIGSGAISAADPVVGDSVADGAPEAAPVETGVPTDTPPPASPSPPLSPGD